MSETFIFIVGVGVFAITVYGTVMAGGTAFTRMELEQNPDHNYKDWPEQDTEDTDPTVTKG